MKKLLSLLAFAGMLFVVSCTDDDPAPANPPSVTAPAAATVTAGETVELSFDFTSDAGLSVVPSATATGGTFEITANGAVGDNSGTITGTFTAGSTAGAGSVVITVTDANASSDATAVITINDVATTPVVRVRGNITENTSWTADNIYVLETRVTVEPEVTLEIAAGTVIKGERGEGAAATALVVARGATLNASGTAALPIVFTSIEDQLDPADIAAGNYASPNLPATQVGLWGGLIILGNAPISAQNDNDEDVTEVQIEGIPSSDPLGLYGGDNPEDNSGTITYISIRHGGTDLASGNEINGLSLGGVGSGTTIQWVEVVANKDDGIEWFGGNVDVSGVLVWNAGDDGLDTDQDWIGTCSNFLVVTPTGGSAFELDGPEGTLNRGVHTFTNGTVYAGALGEELVDLDDDTNASMTNIYFYGIESEIIVESFGGDGNGTFEGWEYTLGAGVSADAVFVDVPAGILTEVAANANTVGVTSAADFGWTFAASSGALGTIGL